MNRDMEEQQEQTQPAPPEDAQLEPTQPPGREAIEEQQEPASSEDAAREEQDRREEGRVPVYHETEVRCLGERYRGTVRDLSRWGAMIECEAEMTVRSYVYVVLPGVGSLPARVTWSRGGRFGANLLEPISDEHFERLIRILPKAPSEAAA
jgi:hypothetical protein